MLNLGQRPSNGFDYYSSPDSQNISCEPKYYGDQADGFRESLLSDDCSQTDSNFEGAQPHQDMIRRLLRQQSEVTDLRELAEVQDMQREERELAYLKAIQSTFGGCQPVEIEPEGPIKEFP